MSNVTTKADHTTSARSSSVVVIGAGISGLATAYALREAAAARGHDLQLALLEASDRPGGKIRSERIDGFLCEWGPNGFLDREPATLELCHKLGLDDQLLPASEAFSKRYIYRRGRLRAVHAHPLRFLSSSVLPFSARLRLLREPWIEPAAPEDDADESVSSFATRRIGPVAARILIDAMQSGIYAGDPDRLSVVSCFPRVVEIERRYGSLIRGMRELARERRSGAEPADAARSTAGAGPSGHLTSFRQGTQVLVDTLAEQLSDHLRCGTRIEAIRQRGDGPGLTIQVAGGPALRTDAIVLACPAYVSAPLLQPVDTTLSGLLREIEYAPLGVVCLGYQRDQIEHPLDGFGFLAPHDEGLNLLGTLWSSSIFADRAPDGHVLLRVMIGGARDAALLDRDDASIISGTHAELAPLLGIHGEPQLQRLYRHPQAIPQYNVGHTRRLRQIDQRLAALPGLLLSGNALRGVGINECIKNAESTAQQVLAYLDSSAKAA